MQHTVDSKGSFYKYRVTSLFQQKLRKSYENLSLSGKVKKIEAQEKRVFLIRKNVYARIQNNGAPKKESKKNYTRYLILLYIIVFQLCGNYIRLYL